MAEVWQRPPADNGNTVMETDGNGNSNSNGNGNGYSSDHGNGRRQWQ